LQAEGHPVIEFVLNDNDVLLAHRRVEGMNFIPGGYSIQGGGPTNSGDDMETNGREGNFTIESNLLLACPRCPPIQH
jgi:hypothetical protein